MSEAENLEKIIKKLKVHDIKFLAENIEDLDDFLFYKELGFELFQGYFLDAPSTMEIDETKEPAQHIILQLIKVIKEEGNNASKLEYFIKQHADLSYKLIEFFNNSGALDTKVESLSQVITLMGRMKLLKWLVIYLYAELSDHPSTKTLLELAMKRAQSMEKEASAEQKDKAYLAGMFSMLHLIFETDVKELMRKVNLDNDITSLVVYKKGIFAGSLKRAEQAEQNYLRKLTLANFEKLNPAELIFTLENSGIDVNKNDF
jgi:EAL and modified HD-GYP domain-containing signal transduction protein